MAFGLRQKILDKEKRKEKDYEKPYSPYTLPFKDPLRRSRQRLTAGPIGKSSDFSKKILENFLDDQHTYGGQGFMPPHFLGGRSLSSTVSALNSCAKKHNIPVSCSQRAGMLLLTYTNKKPEEIGRAVV